MTGNHRGFRWAAIFGLLLSIGVGVIAYNAGLSHGLAQVATTQPPAAPAPYPYAYGWHPFWGFGFGFPLVPVLMFFLLGDVAASFRPEAARRRVMLSVRAAGDLPLVDIDPVRIREVVSNLLTNALRYAPDEGSVAIDARLDTAATIAVAVSDDGPGIAAADLPHVFDRFYKGRASSGSGLGLAIAHNLVTAPGGTISVRSAPGQGATITFTLPEA